ncbi:hypothetical protein N7457_007640 [Penicillium paradoxum]|uniref:uncharacterized protein n=1 Tax=Penicillium paradoxum TaxID=176176 RepID=UPI002547D442|nr:uncharacterized protein N7457_007640 [Penicillium paradoxum]KAJ5772744.1 hypothetical protein N7457_007640 [Penicillium paradoxum]
MALVSANEIRRRTSAPYAPMDEALVPGLVGKALDQQCRRSFRDFVDVVFPNIYYSYNTRVETPWFKILHDEKGTAKAMDSGFRSLGCLQLGRANGDQRLILASQEIYGRGLRDLAQALKSPTTAGTDVTLAGAILLGIYELMNATAETSWLLHSRGISHLLRLRGPEGHCRGFGRTLLLSFRGILVFEAFTRGEACFLESEKWRSILPQILEDEERRGTSCRLGQLMDYAFNEIAQCPGFLVRTKALVASSQTTNAERERLLCAINRSRENLRDLETQMLAGIKANHDGNKKECQAFFGLISGPIKDTSVAFSVEGVQSGIALLQQLSVVLMSDQARQNKVTPWLTLGSGHNEGQIVINHDELAQIAQEKLKMHPIGPHQQSSPKLWHDRIALAMGMPGKG